MKKIILVPLFIAMIASVLYAERTEEVSLRFGRTGTIIRIVLEAGEDFFVRNANTITSATSIKIEFPGPFVLKRPPEFNMEIMKKDRFLVINLKDVIDVKTYKLYSPPRLVFDLFENTSHDERAESRKTEPEESHQNSYQEEESPPDRSLQNPLSRFFRGMRPETQNIAKEKFYEYSKIVLDAGHGGYDYGIVLDGANEKEVNFILAKNLRYALARKGIKTFITRNADQYMSIYDRIIFANEKTPDLFISLHSSSSGTFAVYVSTAEEQNVDALTELYSLSSRQNRHIEESRDIGTSIGRAIKNEFKTVVVLRELPLPILESINAPAILIEYPSPAPYSADQKARERLVNAILKGLGEYED